MYVTELDSFVKKFHQLWKAGFTVHLDLDAHAGKAWVGIRAQLGEAPGPVHQQVHHPSSSRHPQRSPSYQRRQERRRQAAQAAAETVSSSSQVSEQKSSDDMPAAEASMQSETVEKVTECDDPNLADQAEGKQKTWKCTEKNWMGDRCAFESKDELRLKNHMLAEHKVGEHFSCDDCDFVVVDRSEMIKHVETRHGKEYKLCGGNCSDRMYTENSFICGKCESFLCIICSRTEIGEESGLDPSLAYCSACAKELRKEENTA